MGVRDLLVTLDSSLIFPPVEVLTKQAYDGQFRTDFLGAWGFTSHMIHGE